MNLVRLSGYVFVCVYFIWGIFFGDGYIVGLLGCLGEEEKL